MKIEQNSYYKCIFESGDSQIVFTDDTFVYQKSRGEYVRVYTINVFRAIYKRTDDIKLEYLSKDEVEAFEFLEEL